MKTIKYFIPAFFLFTFLNISIRSYSQNLTQKPFIYINNFKKEVKEGDVINCRKIEDMGAVMYLDDNMKIYDFFQIELHRFGENEDAMVAFKKFFPSSKEYQKHYNGKDSIKLKLLILQDGLNSSDFEVNSLLFTVEHIVNNLICDLKEKQHCNFYLVVKGFFKTDERTKFGEDIYDAGTTISLKSITFKNWEDKTN